MHMYVIKYKANKGVVLVIWKGFEKVIWKVFLSVIRLC